MPDGMTGLMGPQAAPQGPPPGAAPQGPPQGAQMVQQLAQGIIQRLGPQGAAALVQILVQMLKGGQP